ADAAREHVQRVTAGGEASNPFLVEVDDLPEFRKEEPAARQPLTVPAILNGRIGKPGEIDSWSVLLRKGDLYDFDLRAGRLGSPLHGFLTRHDAAGKELARADGGAPGQVDPVLRFTATADGTYTVRVQERFRSRGGPAFAYRLRIDRPAAPAF